MKINIELKPDVIEKQTAFGPVEQSLNQDSVIVNGKLAGYVGTHEGAKFCPLSGFPHELQTAVDQYIASARKTDVTKSLPSPPLVDPKTGKAIV